MNGEEKEVKIVFGVEKYNQFPLGRHFASITIDKPLLYLCPKLLILIMVILRIPRQIFFSHNHYMIEYRSSKQYAIANVLTRLPHENSFEMVSIVFTTKIFKDGFLLTAKQLAKKI